MSGNVAYTDLLKLFYESKESKEGVRAFNEKRKPEFRKFVR